MKRVLTVSAVVATLAGLCVMGSAQRVLPGTPSPPSFLPWPGNAWSNVSVFPLVATNAQFTALAPAWKPPPPGQSHAPSTRHRSPAFAANPPPGVYKTAPYTCIVVMPGPCPDDQSVVNPGGGDDSMPILKPDLRFLPLHPPKK